jgi:aryl-phospho-beta-D-glucosidase BglC (GH1 family)
METNYFKSDKHRQNYLKSLKKASDLNRKARITRIEEYKKSPNFCKIEEFIMKKDITGCYVLVDFVDTGVQEGIIVETTSSGYKAFIRSTQTICSIDDDKQIVKNYGQMKWVK